MRWSFLHSQDYDAKNKKVYHFWNMYDKMEPRLIQPRHNRRDIDGITVCGASHVVSDRAAAGRTISKNN